MADNPLRRVLFRDDIAQTTRLFASPLDLIEAGSAEEFFPELARLDAARKDGKWLAGYFSYEAGYLLEPKLAPLLPRERKVPLFSFGVFDAPADSPAEPVSVSSNRTLYDATPAWTETDYAPRFAKLHRHLALGNCYQGNLAFQIDARCDLAPEALFETLIAPQPVRYGALVELGGPAIVSRSPELFFEIDESGFIETSPMKGTISRGQSTAEDAALKETLRNDEKNRAENLMIVDLLRNDISRISEVGTLCVPELFTVETYPTIHTMVSRIRAKLLPGLSIEDVFRALFPCGSVTGAPKIRAMEILRELETAPRDVYCGAIGWIAPHGPMRFNVAIRTITLHKSGRAIFNVGGGIVFDSDCSAEYRECLLKSRFSGVELFPARYKSDLS
ncbi:aminodeoxychorismate synthase component I [Limoniibacter endophyticus]|uniref:Aminodeoxychorismate synthase component I n=1 Tax=Limoniibacter endophyticus TaxID=1565040 RepID=A0A8J3DGD9_9HYPH|nr:aminodeoxychorismate synthase component I [Limoniibacter endophyticus]GHC64317.1 aminodeoxychorismate synthase component I [Limoniibacter endophyticus]